MTLVPAQQNCHFCMLLMSPTWCAQRAEVAMTSLHSRRGTARCVFQLCGRSSDGEQDVQVRVREQAHAAAGWLGRGAGHASCSNGSQLCGPHPCSMT